MESGVPGRPGLPAVKHAAAERKLDHDNATILPRPGVGQPVWETRQRQLLASRVTVQVGFNREFTQKGQ